MTYKINGRDVTIIRTGDFTSEGTPIFKFATWDGRGQMVDSGYIAANCAEHARLKMMEW